MDIKTALLLPVVCFALVACNSDNDAPKVDSITPSSILAGQETLTIRFTESVKPDSLSLASASLNQADFNVVWNDDNTQVIITPVSHWPGGEHQVTIEVKDEANNKLTPIAHRIKANLVFENFQHASAEIVAQAADEGEETAPEFTIESPFSSQFANSDGLWIASYGSSTLHFFSDVPEENGAQADYVITSFETLNEDQEVESVDLNGPQTPFVVNGQLLLVEYDSGSIVVFDEIPKPDQDNFAFQIDTDSVECSALNFSSPEAIFSVDGKLLLADADNNRVLIWNQIPTDANDEPDLVVGQNSFTNCAENDEDQSGANEDEETATARTLAFPTGLWSDGERLLVAESNRVLIWNQFPDANFVEADLVLGQQDFNSQDSNFDPDEELDGEPSNRNFDELYEGISSNGRQIYATDSQNHRVMIWNDWPTENFAPADIVLGQSTFTNNGSNDDDQSGDSDAPTLRVMDSPAGVTVFDDKLIVSDVNNDRVLIFKSL